MTQVSMTQESIQVLSTEGRTFPPPKEFSRRAHIKSIEEYEKIYQRSVEDPEGFWGEMAEKHLTWYKKWDQVWDWDFHKPSIKFFINGKLNASYNCLDRHLTGATRNKAAIIWEGDDGSYKTFTYQQLSMEVNRFANVLKNNGIKKGDRVTLYLPMIPELVIAMLACARIGAIHCIVFGGFSPSALKDRIQDCRSSLLVHGGQRPAGQQAGAPQDQCRRGLEGMPHRDEGDRGPAGRKSVPGPPPGRLVA